MVEIADISMTEERILIKVLFLIDTLRDGGAERVLVNLVNHIDKSKYEITVETLFDSGINLDRLSPDVHYFCKKAPYPKGIGLVFSCIPARILYRYFVKDTKYDVIIAFMHGASTKIISGCSNDKVKRITWLHTGNPENSSFFSFWFSKKKAISAYASCDAIVGVAQSVVDAFSRYTGINERLHVVYNTNETEKIQKMSVEESFELNKPFPVICSVGRLVSEKGYDRLISAVENLHKEGYRFHLVIVGKGEEQDTLTTTIRDLNAESYIHLLGEKKNPYPFVASSDFFVCSSRQEGLSTAVTEAIILGKPVISTDVSGAKEILGENDEYGFVVENSESGIYSGIKTFLDKPDIVKHYASKAKERALFFSTEKTVKQVEDLIDAVNSTNAC